MRYDLMERILSEGTAAEAETVKDALQLWQEAEEQETDIHADMTDEDYYPDWEIRNDVTPFRQIKALGKPQGFQYKNLFKKFSVKVVDFISLSVYSQSSNWDY